MRTIDNINYYLSKQQKNGADLCEYLGVSSGVYSQWNTGRTRPRKSKLPVIAEFLGVSVNDLVGDDSTQQEKPTAKGDGLISGLPQDVQKIISLCQENPQLASALLNLAQQLQNRSSDQA